MKKLAIVTAVAALVLGFGAGQALAATFVVDDDGFATAADCDNVSTVAFTGATAIQDAIEAATTAGDIILVCPGVYVENVNVNLAGLVVIGLKVGSFFSCAGDLTRQPCVFAAGGTGSAIEITASGVTVRGFKVTGSGTDPGDAGIRVVAAANTTLLRKNTAFDNRHGIFILSNMNTLDGNHVKRNDFDGIHIQGDNNTLTDNKAKRNGDDGFDILSSNGAIGKRSTFSGNRATRNGDCGFEDEDVGFEGVANYDTIGKDQDSAAKNDDNDIPGSSCADFADTEH